MELFVRLSVQETRNILRMQQISNTPISSSILTVHVSQPYKRTEKTNVPLGRVFVLFEMMTSDFVEFVKEDSSKINSPSYLFVWTAWNIDQ